MRDRLAVTPVQFRRVAYITLASLSLIDDNAGNTDAACQCRKLAGGKFTDYLAGCRIDLLNQCVVRSRIDAKLIRLA